MLKTYILITIIFQVEGIMLMPPIEYPTMDTCFKGREMIHSEMVKTLGPVGTNWNSICIQKDFSELVEGTPT